VTRLRIRFAKLGKIRWTSHRDTARMWERAFRRASLPVAYSQGFSPRPKVSFGLALSTGYESLAEYLDIELSDSPLSDSQPQLDLESLAGDLTASLPAGVEVVAISASADKTRSLQEEVTACTWRLAVAPMAAPDGTVASPGPAGPDIGARLDQLLAADSLVIPRTRKGREVVEDIRPAILALRPVDETADGLWIECDLATQPRSLRPTELVAALGPDLEERFVRRLYQWIERDGARWEPLAAPPEATDAPHALERAL
jgi:radical SAM-linked protein